MTGRHPALERLGERLNPVLVKELRQAVRARYVAALLSIYVAINVVIMGLFLLNIDVDDPYGSAFTAGRSAYFTLLFFLQVVTTIFVPGFVAVRLTAERTSDDLNLMLTTSLSPAAVIRGKLISGLVIVMQLYSIALPFMALTYLLRGIDLLTILVVTSISLLTVTPVLQLAILIATLPVRRMLRALIMVVAAAVLFYLLPVMTVLITMDLASGGVGSLALSRSFWIAAVAVLLVDLCLVVILYAWSIAALSAPAGNRAMPQRVAVSVAWLVSGAMCSLLAASFDEDIILPWYYLSLIVISFLMLAAISERDEPGERIARQIPRSLVLRALVFPFFTGAANALIWCCTLAGLTLAGLALGHLASVWSLSPRLEDHLMIGLAMVTQILCYSLLAHNIHRRLGHRPRRHPAWLIACALITGGCVISVLLDVFAFGGSGSGAGSEPWRALNPFSIGNEEVRAILVFLGPPAAAVLALMSRSFLWRQVKAFKPL